MATEVPVDRLPGSLPMASAARPLVVAGLCGLVAVSLYVAATILGGTLTPGYSPMRDAISELTASRAPYRMLLAAMYVGYNLVLVGFAAALAKAGPTSRALRVAVVVFAVAALSGIGQVTMFPQDSTGTAGTPAGTGHLVLAGISAVLSVVSTVLIGVALRRTGRWRSLSTASFAVTALLLIVGPVAAASAGGPHMGLWERLTIGSFLAWVAGVSTVVLTRVARLDPGTKVRMLR